MSCSSTSVRCSIARRIRARRGRPPHPAPPASEASPATSFARSHRTGAREVPELPITTSTVSQHDWSLHRKGAVDQERHKQKIREAIKKNLGDIVSEESIILSDGKKVVKVPIRSLDEYRFRYDPGRQEHAGEGNGKSKVGDVIAQEPRSGQGKGKKGDPGKEAGYDYYEAEISMEELAAMIFEDLGLP